MTRYAAGLTWGEGPRWHDGALWASDPQRGGIWTDRSGAWTFTALTSRSNGLWFLPDGRLVGAVTTERRVGAWNGTEFAPYADLSAVATGPLGDMVGDAHGGLYVDDVGYTAHLGEEPKPGRIVHVGADGQARIAAEGVQFPNGLAFIDDGRVLVVAETWEQRLMAYTVRPDGTLTDPRLYADLRKAAGPEARPDGICATADGTGVWACTLTGHSVVRVTPDGVDHILDFAPGSPVACTTDGRSRLFVTVANSGGRPVMQAVADKTVTSSVEVIDL
ncbi:gluconolactonase [Streptomyces sulfonofaciens]|uniref:Gluconolactonase n=1 Tax=Streptomyces sulfonofaciens TaxID=68272 RepID=A0A919GMP8_9ACTN|nr:SMP-30/gluconolactonase/LRE family protein [Streptomyces sulfonofaciens]GHH87437.1 gluconolactonase [Streptomyces sulfonofaciens]